MNFAPDSVDKFPMFHNILKFTNLREYIKDLDFSLNKIPRNKQTKKKHFYIFPHKGYHLKYTAGFTHELIL